MNNDNTKFHRSAIIGGAIPLFSFLIYYYRNPEELNSWFFIDLFFALLLGVIVALSINIIILEIRLNRAKEQEAILQILRKQQSDEVDSSQEKDCSEKTSHSNDL